MARSIYETKLLSGYALDSIKSELELQVVSGKGIVPADGYPGIFFVTEEVESVPPFPLPIELNEKYYIDARPFTSISKNGELKIRDMINSNFQLELAVLERTWVHSEYKDEFYCISNFLISSFSHWLGSNLKHNWRLDYTAELQFNAAAALYYTGLHYNNINDDMVATRLKRNITKHVTTSYSDIEFITNDQVVEFPRDVVEFSNFLVASDIHLMLKSFKPMSLINIMAKTFTFGLINPKVVVEVAMEHPPVFIALVGTILKNQFLRKTILGEQLYKQKDRDQFLTYYNRFIARNNQ